APGQLHNAFRRDRGLTSRGLTSRRLTSRRLTSRRLTRSIHVDHDTAKIPRAAPARHNQVMKLAVLGLGLMGRTHLKALRAGKHVLVEKPMALDGEAADRMIREAEARGRVLMTAQVLRFFPEYMALEQAIRAPELGRVRCATFRRRCGAPAWGGWLKDPLQSGG